ncbi:MlaD family protein [Tropicibacter sp. S64]|uniref:MlaD family protein n=1 Tax=Tropicibacter sp. S64 TaxID=3415122 RepID=UPI003C7B38CE
MTSDTEYEPLAEVPVEKPKKGPRFSFVWLIPVLALLVALGVAFQNWSERGPLIEVVFVNADGVHAGETELRYRDIAVGLVEKVGFSANLEEVVVSIRLDKDVARYVDDQSQFWVVRPEVTAQGVSGLDTVLSGVYIEGAWDGTTGEAQSRFTGSPKAPMLELGEKGTTFTLRSDDKLPAGNTPILYHGVKVGRLGETEVSPDGLTVEAEAVILEPYDKLVTENTRFWDISGFSFSLDAGGAKLQFNSLASLISGGVTFATLSSGGTQIADGATYDLHPSEEAARENFFLEGDGGSVDLMMVFDENLSGLSAGAPVQLGGLRMGEVVTISGLVDEARFGDDKVRLVATIRLNPGRIGLEDSTEEGFLDYLETRVRRGLRGQLTNASLLTGGLKIDLVDLPNAPEALLDRTAEPYPLIPTTESNVANMAASAQGLLSRVDALPVEELLENAVNFLADARALVNSDGIQEAPEELRATLAAIRSVAESDEVASLPAQIGQVADGLEQASVQLNALLTDVQDKAIVTAVSDLIARIDETAQTLPGIAEQAGAVLAKAEALPLEDLSAQLSSVLDNADAFIANEDLNAMPADLRAAIASVNDLVQSAEVAALPGQIGQVASGLEEASATLNTLLKDVQDRAVVQSVSELIASIDETAAALPGLTEQAGAVLGKAQALPLEDLSAQLSQMLGNADTLVSNPDLNAMPGDLRTAIASVNEIVGSPEITALPGQIASLAKGLLDSSDRLNTLLQQVDQQEIVRQIGDAVAKIDAAAGDLPEISQQAKNILSDVEELSLQTMADRATELMDTAEALLAQPSTQQVPEQLNATLAELRGTLEEVRRGGLVDNANATLASARSAAEALAQASTSLPALADRISRVAAQAGVTLGDYSRGSDFGREMSAALREIEAAAQSFDRLARQIARNPNSLLTGR